jgi:AcrR family transcriptional regulator
MARWADRGEARERLRQVRRDRILQEAARCFNRQGYRGTTIDDIARRLGVSTAALYYYFKSKEELLFACHRMSMEIGMECLRRAEAAGGTPAERLRDALEDYIQHITDDLHGGVAMIEEGALSRARYRQVVKLRDEYEREIRRIIEEGVETNVFDDCDAAAVGFAILGAVNWIPKLYRPKGRRSGKEIARIFSAYLVRGLLKQPAATDALL